jgi:hypothetical protein
VNPFQNPQDINKNNFIAKINSKSTYNERLSSIIGKVVYYKIDDMGNFLDDSKCLYVQTATSDNKYYYAVMVFEGKNIISNIVPGQNTLKFPVSEKIEQISPVFQMVIDTFGHKNDIYVHWVSKYENNLYPSMTNTYNFAYNFSLVTRGKKRDHPLFVYLHARWSNFLTNNKGTGNPQEWIISLDDYLPNDIMHTFWYGYHQDMNFFNPDKIPHEGFVDNYTVKRVDWTLKWLTETFSIDTNRIYLSGGSMGGGGSIIIGIELRKKIAAVYSFIPKFDYSFLYDPNIGSIYNKGTARRKLISRLWGDHNINLFTKDSIQVYDRLNAGYMARKYMSETLPFIIAFNGKYDNVVGWGEKINFYKAFNDAGQAGVFYWDSRTHSSTDNAELFPEHKISDIYKYTLNKSFPAFSNCSANNYPGDGNNNSGDKFGTINGFLDWSDSIRDEEDYYEIYIFPKTILTTEGTIQPPEKIRVDITLRRLQNFRISSLKSYYYQNINSKGELINDGYVDLNKYRLLQIKGFEISGKGNFLKIKPVPLRL